MGPPTPLNVHQQGFPMSGAKRLTGVRAGLVRGWQHNKRVNDGHNKLIDVQHNKLTNEQHDKRIELSHAQRR